MPGTLFFLFLSISTSRLLVHTAAREESKRQLSIQLPGLSRLTLVRSSHRAAQNYNQDAHRHVMKNTIVPLGLLALASAASAASAVTETHITAAEWAPYTGRNNDPYQCVLDNIPQYLTGAPTPTADLDSVLFSYEKSLFNACTRPVVTHFEPCPVPPRKTLCAFSAVVPTSLLPVYSSYASSAAAWWGAGKGDKVVSLAENCPYLWYDSLLRYPGSGMNLNRTIEHAQCWVEAHPTGAVGGTATLSGGTSASTKASSGGSGATQTPKPTSTSGGVRSRAGAADGWMVAGWGMGVAAAAMNGGLW